MTIDERSLLNFVNNANRRIATLERGALAPKSSASPAVTQRQFVFVKLCEPLFPGEEARGNIVVWSNAEEEFVESGTGCVIVHDDLCRTFALPGMIVPTHQRFNKLIAYGEFGITNVPAIRRDVLGQIRFEVVFSPHCYWNTAIYLETTDTVAGDYSDGDEVYLSLDRNRCSWHITGEKLVSVNTTTTPEKTCEGTCSWIWNDTTGKWELDNDGCAESTTTTTTTTPDPGTTTTTTTTTTPGEEPLCVCLEQCTTTTPGCGGECEYICVEGVWQVVSNDCPGDCNCPEPELPCTNGETAGECVPDSTTTTTTTTPAPCNCAPPSFCGIADGDHTDTYCVPGVPIDPPDCTTTTPCDCTCTGTCDWRFIEGRGWLLVDSDCPYGDDNQVTCGCQEPATGGEHCDTESTPCVAQPDEPPYCEGECKWVWIPEFGDWYYVSNQSGCLSIGYECRCNRPSEPPDDTEDCVVDWTPCLKYSDGPDGQACDLYCTTTTTPDICDQECVWRWSVTNVRWEKIVDDCDASCPCEQPPRDGDSNADTYQTRCGVQTTTTTTEPPTTTTTTTTTTPGANCATDCRWVCTESGWLKEPTDICEPPLCTCPTPGAACTISEYGNVVYTACAGVVVEETTTTTTPAS